MIKVSENISLRPFNTFGIEATARYLAKVENTDDIKNILQSELFKNNPFLILGEGSNILFTGKFNGLVLHPEIKGIDIIEKNGENVFIKAGCGENWDNFVNHCVKLNLCGIENLSYIPGSVGASPIQNIGAYGVEVKDVIEWVEAVDTETAKTVILKNNDCHFAYRDSIFKRQLKNKLIITNVVFKLSINQNLVTHYGNIEKDLQQYAEKNVASVRDIIIKTRKEKLPDPAGFGNAGSFFKNPVVSVDVANQLLKNYPVMPFWRTNSSNIKLSAAWLIEQSGMKGKRNGNTGTFPRQPLVIVNYGDATGEDVLKFAHTIIKTVDEKFGIELETEVNII